MDTQIGRRWLVLITCAHKVLKPLQKCQNYTGSTVQTNLTSYNPMPKPSIALSCIRQGTGMDIFCNRFFFRSDEHTIGSSPWLQILFSMLTAYQVCCTTLSSGPSLKQLCNIQLAEWLDRRLPYLRDNSVAAFNWSLVRQEDPLQVPWAYQQCIFRLVPEASPIHWAVLTLPIRTLFTLLTLMRDSDCATGF